MSAPPDGDELHEALGAVVRSGLAQRGASAPVPLVPPGLRAALRRRRRGPGRPFVALAAGAAATLALAVVAAALGWFPGPSLTYVVERGPAETRIRFSDGSTVVADAGTRLRVVGSRGTGADLRLEDGAARFRLGGGRHARWSIAAGPYLLAAVTAELDLSWSEARGTLSGTLAAGGAAVRGPGWPHGDVRLASGQTLVARTSDGFWRVGGAARPSGHHVALAVAGAPGLAPRCRQSEPGPPVPRGGGSPSAQPWVWLDAGGCLGYARDARGDRVPDFSQAGYRGGGVPLPLVARAAGTAPVAATGAADDTARIQTALDAVAARSHDETGFRGAVELGPGTFTIAGTIHINASGVVLRGQGSDGAGATVLRAVGTARPLVMVGPEARRTVDRSQHRIVDPYLAVGATTFELDAVGELQVGDDVVVMHPFSPRWLAAMGSEGGSRRHPGQPDPGRSFERRVTAIDGPRVTVDVPLPDAIDRQYGEALVARYSFPERIASVGVERLAGEGAFDPQSDLGDGIFIEVVAAQDGWVRQVASRGFEAGIINLDQPSKAITVMDAAYVAPALNPDGWSRAFILGGQQHLLLRCRATGAQNAVATWPRTAGPNVVLDFTSVGRSAVAAPARWTSGLLLDGLRFVDEGTSDPAGEVMMAFRAGGRGQGWSASSSVVWNGSSRRMLVDNPPDAQNWVIGPPAPETFGSATADSSPVVRPDSLYRAQLGERLGEAGLAALAR